MSRIQERKRPHGWSVHRGGVLAAGTVTGLVGLVSGPSASGELSWRVEGGGRQDRGSVSNLFLYVPAGSAPSPFVPPGAFRAEWTGSVESELRGDYQFRAHGNGTWRLELNGAAVVEGAALKEENEGGWTAPVRLRKGPNALRVLLDSATNGSARLRVEWKGRGVGPGPIPEALLGPGTTDREGDEAYAAARRGRGAFLELRCGRCHEPASRHPNAVELGAEAPSFAGIGSRLEPEWMARWIENPRAMRSEATMPRLREGPAAKEESRAMAAWLASLKASEGGPRERGASGNAAVGRALFGSLLCDACHVAGGAPSEAGKIDLAEVGRKFRAGALQAYLEAPSRHHAWNPMPDFRLSAGEAANLAAWLTGALPARTELGGGAEDRALVERGRVLVEERGCLACHGGAGTNRLAAPALARLSSERWQRGCLGETEAARGGKAPWYELEPGRRADLRALAGLDREAVGRWTAWESAERGWERLRCAACHGGKETVPWVGMAGEKLRPEWTTRLLRGEAGKARPWLQARMPAYAAHAELLAGGLAATRGLPPVSPVEPPPDAAAAADGRKLASASGGFSCVTCHAIGAFGAAGVFEAPGVNFARIGERLLPEYFARWVRNPQAIEPTTKMPLYFDEEGNSALADFYGGDGPKTIHALWNYVRQGERIEPPTP